MRARDQVGQGSAQFFEHGLDGGGRGERVGPPGATSGNFQQVFLLVVMAAVYDSGA